MGRGWGELQWQLLIVLSEHERTVNLSKGLDTLELARRVHGREPTRSELVSIRRALAALRRDGAVDHLGWRYEHRHHWRYQRHAYKRFTGAP